ncbi:MAG: amidohydrolase family protein, partial [Planctomycetes bacterium]|nr:amidohydrolase family protein [Planctomycetota bacterium]
MNVTGLHRCFQVVALALAVGTQGPLAAQDAKPADLLLRVGRVHVGDGRVLENVRIRIHEGKFQSIEPDTGALPEGVEVRDLRRMSLMPGLVAAHTDLVAVDLEPNLSPGSVAADQFDLYRKYDALVRSGLTTVYLSPGRQRLVSGQGSVVKLAGNDPMNRVLRPQSAMRVAVDSSARNGIPAVFEPTESPTDDDPLVPARQQWGSTRASQLQALDNAFAEARIEGKERGGVGSDLVRYPLDPLRQVLRNELPIRLATGSAADAWAALTWAKSIGAKTVLEKPDDVVPLRDDLARSDVPVIVAMPLRPGAPNAGDYVSDPDARRVSRPEAAGELARAGVKVAIVPPSDQDLDKLRMLAGLAGRYGLPARSALASVTLEAAKMLGVDARVGSIEPGKDADFVVLTGAPFDARTQVEAVYVDGNRLFTREDRAPVFAIRAERVLAGDGQEYRNGVVVVKGN